MSGTLGTIYDDGAWATILPCSLPELTAPIPGVNAKYILTQDFQQAEASYAPAPLNTPYPKADGTLGVSGETWAGSDAYNSAGYILVEEGPLRDQGGGVVRWTRTYARVPDQHFDPCQMAFQFPGYLAAGNGLALLRNPFTRTVPGTIEYTYFLAGTNTQAAVQALEKANFVSEQLFLWPRPTGDIPLPNEAFIVNYIWSSISPEPTVPTLETYVGWVTYGTNTIVAQPSQFTRWMGNIIRREVITILPA